MLCHWDWSTDSQCSSVSTVIVSGWTTEVRFPAGQDSSVCHSVQTSSGTQPASYRVRSEVLSSGVEPWGHEPTTHLHLVPEVNNAWRCASTPPYICMGWCLVKHQTALPFASAALPIMHSWHVPRVPRPQGVPRPPHQINKQEKCKISFDIWCNWCSLFGPYDICLLHLHLRVWFSASKVRKVNL
jgi:hypothetical protein